MKTIQQLLELSKNPHYTFMPDEQRVLDAFLAKKRATSTKVFQKEYLNKSSETMPVTVRNVVQKVDTYPPDEQDV